MKERERDHGRKGRTVTEPADGRWPRWVYDEGEEPDYRFSFANERTFLAWIRTGLALIAAGVAVDTLRLDLPDVGQHVLAGALVLLGAFCALAAWWRWAHAERAMRGHQPLPSSRSTAVLAAVVVVIGALVLVLAA
jgi:putative membrane protein